MHSITARVHYRGGHLPEAVIANTISSENVREIAELLPYLHAIANDPLITRISPSAVIRSDHATAIELAERVLFDHHGNINWHLDQALVDHGYYLYARPTPQALNLQLPNCRLILTNPY
jgi:hypothetical protein